MVDWTAAALDINHTAAAQLVDAANRMYREDPYLFEELEAGDITLDRAMATMRLLGANAPESVVDKSFELDLTAVNRLTHQYRRISHKDEQQTFSDRHFVIQPSLDVSRCRRAVPFLRMSRRNTGGLSAGMSWLAARFLPADLTPESRRIVRTKQRGALEPANPACRLAGRRNGLDWKPPDDADRTPRAAREDPGAKLR